MGDVVPFVIAFLIAMLLTPIAVVVGARIKWVDRPAALKIHGSEIPVTGGIAVVIALFAGAATGTIPGGPWTIAAILVAFAVGVADDLRSLSVIARLAAEVLAGLLLVTGDLRLWPLGPVGGLALVVAAVALCNAVNMTDGQDGLAAGLISIAAFGLAWLALDRSLPLALAGATLGFLVWNRPPARVFLGDSGAYAAAIALAACAADPADGGLTGVAAVGACLGVFIVELASTVVRRVRGRSLALQGDRDHTYDRLAVQLDSRSWSTLVMWAAGAVAALAGALLQRATAPVAVIFIVTTTTVAVGVLALTAPFAPKEVH